MTSATPDTVAFPVIKHHRRPAVSYQIALLGAHMCVNNLPKVVTSKWNRRESNPRPVSRKSNILTAIHHHGTLNRRNFWLIDELTEMTMKIGSYLPRSVNSCWVFCVSWLVYRCVFLLLLMLLLLLLLMVMMMKMVMFRVLNNISDGQRRRRFVEVKSSSSDATTCVVHMYRRVNMIVERCRRFFLYTVKTQQSSSFQRFSNSWSYFARCHWEPGMYPGFTRSPVASPATFPAILQHYGYPLIV